MSEFFVPGTTYRHYGEDGEPTAEGLFLCVYAGRAPAAFEHYSEELGVAFGWRQGIGPNGEWEALGSYETPDFAGWREVRPLLESGVPDGCRWCNQPRPHGHQYVAGVGLHQWAQPTDRQRLERMQARRAERLAPKPVLAVTPEMLVTITANAGTLYRQFAPAEPPPVRPTDAG